MNKQLNLWHLFLVTFVVALVLGAYRLGYRHAFEDMPGYIQSWEQQEAPGSTETLKTTQEPASSQDQS